MKLTSQYTVYQCGLTSQKKSIIVANIKQNYQNNRCNVQYFVTSTK